MTLEWTTRPWGRYTVLHSGPEATVKFLEVYPGQAISLQHHDYRDERWYVAEGTPVIWIDEEVLTGVPYGVYDVPAGTIHRIGNATSNTVKIVEVMTGYYHEDDIVRHEDYYGRV